MTPLNNQELRKKIDDVVHQSGVGEEYQVRVLKASLLALFESELANREREACKKGFIKGGIDEIIRNDKAIKEIEAQLQNNSSKGEDA